MNRSELVQLVAEHADVNKSTADRAVAAFVDAVIADAKKGHKVQIFGFGTFTPTSRPARTGRNPQTGEPVHIAASKSVRFSPAAAFKSSLNTKGAAKVASQKSTTKKKAPAARSSAKSGDRRRTTSTRAKSAPKR